MQINSKTIKRIICAAILAITCFGSGQFAKAQNTCCPPKRTACSASARTARSSGVFEPAHGSYGLNDVETMYEANSRKPLGGFFAKGFTRTFTLMGGFNELSTVTASGENQEPLDSIFENTQTGYAISAAMGRRHSGRLRSEIEFAVRGNDFTFDSPALFVPDVDSDVNVYSLMKNAFLELENASRFTPYGGAGIGLSYVEAEAQTISGDAISVFEDSDTVFTWQAIGGVATRINRATDFVVEYRFLGTTDVELGSIGQETPYYAQNLFLGIKFEY